MAADVGIRWATRLRGAPRMGRPPLLDANDQKRLIAALKAGALAPGYSSDLWTLDGLAS